MVQESAAAAEWAKFWDQAQQQAWGSWGELLRHAEEAASKEPREPWRLWSDGIQRLWQATAPALSGTQRDVFAKLVEQGGGFLLLSDIILKACERMQVTAEQGGDWKRVLRGAIDHAQAQLRASGESVGAGATLWALPAEMWGRLAAALAVVPDSWTRAWHRGAIPAGLQELPQFRAAGVAREWQEHVQEGAHCSERYRNALLVYTAKLVEVGDLALEYLYERLVEHAEAERPIESLRELYDLWIDAAEEAYTAVVSTPEFTAAQGDMVNTALAMKRQVQVTLEKAAGTCNLPTRDELDQAQRAIHDLRSEVRALQKQIQALREVEPADGRQRAAANRPRQRQRSKVR